MQSTCLPKGEYTDRFYKTRQAYDSRIPHQGARVLLLREDCNRRPFYLLDLHHLVLSLPLRKCFSGCHLAFRVVGLLPSSTSALAVAPLSPVVLIPQITAVQATNQYLLLRQLDSSLVIRGRVVGNEVMQRCSGTRKAPGAGSPRSFF